MIKKVVLIENRPLVQQAIQAELKREPKLQVIPTTGEEDSLLRSIQEIQPQVIFLNVKVCHRDPVMMVENLIRACPNARILALLDRNQVHLAHIFFDLGVRSCLLETDEKMLSLPGVVCEVADGRYNYSPEFMDQYSQPSKCALTPRSIELLRLVAEGLTDQAIADQYQVSCSTIRNRLWRIYRKLGIPSDKSTSPRIKAANKARDLGLL